MADLAAARSLLLNASYEPMRIVSWQRALILWFQEKAEILEYHQIFARSVRSSFQLPSILRLKNYVRPRHSNAVRFCRENVYIRDEFTCQYCLQRFATSMLTLDHVVPASKMGKKTWSNVVTACRNCNQKKGNKTPDQAGMPLKTQPKAPAWLPTVGLDLKPEKVPSSWKQYLRVKATAS
jgi:5-methylcytosine-specific restriction endonuclease McrA